MMRVVHFIGRIVMFRQNYRAWIERACLSFAVGTTLVATRQLVLSGTLYDMPYTQHNTLLDWCVDWVFFSACCFALLMAHALLTRTRQQDASDMEYTLLLFLVFGPLLGAVGAVAEGWRLGLESFILGGVTLALFGALVGLGFKAVVYAGMKLDALLQHLRT